MSQVYIPIKTKRLLLRDFQLNDWSKVHSYACDEEVVRYQEWGPNSVDDTKNFIDRSIKSSQLIPRLDFELAVILLANNDLIGGAGIHISDAANREGWIGYSLNKSWWRQGIGTEAAMALIKFGFSSLGLHRIFATVDPNNIASAKILAKIGMRHEGHFKSHKLVRGLWRHTDRYAIIEPEL